MTYPWKEAPADAHFAVIGDPVKHSLSPRMHNAAFASLGLAHRYVAVHVPVGEVGPALDHLRTLGYFGVNVTVPHKADALAWSRRVEPFAQQVQAVNTLRPADQAGLNTDGPGFLETLRLRGVQATQGDVLLLGAGGSARAVAHALAGAGYRMRIHNRTRARAEELAWNLAGAAHVVDELDPARAGLIVNTTSASLAGERLEIDWTRAEPGATAYDLMYTNGLTPFLAEASAAGLGVLDGRDLLVAQGALAFEWWTGQEAPRDVMREAIA
jgi:shikimate dehydrogenase